MEALRDIMSQEELFIMRSPEQRRIMIDLYVIRLRRHGRRQDLVG